MSESIFELEEFKQYKKAWESRAGELRRRASYYDGSIYTDKLRTSLGFLAPRLYKGIKPLYLPLSRAVDVDTGMVPAGWELPEDEPKSEQWKKAIDTVFDWSNWDTDGVLYVHYGAQSGVSGLRIADIREEERRVIIQPVDPCLFMLVSDSMYADSVGMALWVEKKNDSEGEEYEYAEVITPENIRTYKNGVLMGFDGREPEYKNELGFVPYVEVRHIETGKPLGEATFQRSIPLLDEVNAMASYLADIVKKNADAQWAVMGADPTDLAHSSDIVWFFPAGTDVKPLVPGIDIDGVLNFVKEIAGNVRESLPELAFDELRSKDQIATATVELQLMELILKIKRIRPNYDKGLVTALRMAGRAAVTMGLPEIAILDDDELRFETDRAIIPPDPREQIELELARLELENMQTRKQEGTLPENA